MVENRRRPARRSYKRAEFNKGMQKKLAIVFVLIILALFALCIRIGYLTKAKGDEYSIKVLAQQGYTSKTLPYKRGDILDRNGNVLATSVKVYNLVIDSKVILSNKKYLEPTVNVLTRYFDLNKDELTKGIKERKDNSYWVVLKQLEAEETTKSGIILTSSAQEKPQEAEVIAVGPGGMVDGKEVKMQVTVGQKVIYSKYAGTEVKLDGEEYIIVRQNDILAVVE